jgi:hypothetical protein
MLSNHKLMSSPLLVVGVVAPGYRCHPWWWCGGPPLPLSLSLSPLVVVVMVMVVVVVVVMVVVVVCCPPAVVARC